MTKTNRRYKSIWTTLALTLLVLSNSLMAQTTSTPPQQSPTANQTAPPTSAIQIGSAPAQLKYMQISPIFSQVVAFSVPRTFVEVYENMTPVQVSGHTNLHAYIRESVLSGETVDHWSQMITVTGFEGAASVPSISPRKAVANLASNFSKACPATFNSIDFGPFDAGTYHAYAQVLSCGTNTQLATPQSESTLMVGIVGDQDIYTIEWAVRSAPSSVKLDLDNNQWGARLQQLQPIKLCPKLAPYTNCADPSAQWQKAGELPLGASVPTAPPPCATPGSAQCPIVINGKLNPEILRTFKVGFTTAADVKHALGEPANENHNPDGRFALIYSPGEGRYIYALVFNPNETLNKIVVFGKKVDPQTNSNSAVPPQ